MAGCRCAPSLLMLRAQVDASWPGRDKSSDGCCGDAAHSNRKSDHNPTNGFAHALDIDEDVVVGMGDKPLWEFGIGLLTDSRTKYLIYEARILYPDGTDRPYSGPNAHKHHLHISIKSTATHDTRPWPVPVPDEEDEEMPLAAFVLPPEKEDGTDRPHPHKDDVLFRWGLDTIHCNDEEDVRYWAREAKIPAPDLSAAGKNKIRIPSQVYSDLWDTRKKP